MKDRALNTVKWIEHNKGKKSHVNFRNIGTKGQNSTKLAMCVEGGRGGGSSGK